MEFKLTLALPRDSLTIPVVRHLLTDFLSALGVDDECREDVRLAITEACTNVLDHAVEGDDYEVSCRITSELCIIEIVDRGHGFDPATVGRQHDLSAEAGRGIELMRALVDRIAFTNRPEAGTIVHLEKKLAWAADAPMARLASD